MKTMIALGLAMLSVLLVVALRHTGTSPHPFPEAAPASTEAQQTLMTADARRATSPGLRATEPAQPVHALLLAAVEAETDPDRRSEALERAVESVAGADLHALLDSLAHDASPGAAELRHLAVRRWVETDAPAAAAWTSQLPEGPVGRAALEQVAIGLGHRRPARRRSLGAGVA